MAGNNQKELPIGPYTSVREAAERYPGIEVVFDAHGLRGCGGAGGPVEPIVFFARVHQVDPAALLRELNEFAARRSGAEDLPVVEGRPKPARQLYFIAVIISLAIAVGGGFPLGILAALGGGRDIGLGARWTPIVQAHGHLQLVGFVGLFIVGITFHILPRFKNTDLALPRLALFSIGLLAAGAILRAFTQPWANRGATATLTELSAALELAGAMAFGAVAWSTLRGTQRKNYDRFLMAGVTWFVAASAANLVVLGEMTRDGVSVIAGSRDTPLIEMYLFGFVGLFVMGVSIRVLPHFLSLRAPRVRYFMPALALFNAGLMVRVAGGWFEAYGSWTRPEWLETGAIYAMAAAVLLFIFAMNLHLPSVRDETADQERSHEKLVRTAYAWLTIAFSIEAWYATRAVAGDFQPDFLEGGGVRHALALGFVTQMIFGVGARALPVFAGKQIHSRRLVDVTWVLINIAVVMRVGHAIIPAGSMTFRFDDIAVSGALGLIAVLVFAYNIARSVRPAQQSQPQVEEEQMPTLPPPPYSVTNSSVVADVIKNVPGSLDVLVSYGFKPLADPELRARVASSVTLGMACDMHGVDLQALISDITALQNGEARAASPRQRILNALRECYDPEIPVNIVDLGLVYEVEADDRHAVVRLTLTSPDCPVADQVVSDVTDRLRRLGIPDVKVSLIREPAWDPSRMTPAARQALGAP